MSSVDGDRESTEGQPMQTEETQVGDERRQAVWRQWLFSMSQDAEAALAAAIAYRDLDPESRESFLNSLEQDAPKVNAPAVALYAPLLSVERDPVRRSRLIEAIGPGLENARPRALHHALSGIGTGGRRVIVLVIPLYLDFVQVLACQTRAGSFEWVKHDPIVSQENAPIDGVEVGGIVLETVPFRGMIDEMAQVVVSHRRSGGELPEALMTLADLFRLDA